MDLPSGDGHLVQITDAALADATRRSGAWLVCRPGCTQCCIGVFPISQLDALRLRRGLDELESRDPERAARIRHRVLESRARLRHDFPGDAATGVLTDDESSEERFADFANDEPCPVLDPATGLCDLYGARPIPCRVFGPPVRNAEGGLGVCELCFQGASAGEVARCEMTVDPDDLENQLIAELENAGAPRGNTIVAFVFND